MLGDALQSPSGAGHVCGGQGDLKLLRQRMFAAIIPAASIPANAETRAGTISSAHDGMDNFTNRRAHTLTFGVDRTGIDVLTIAGAFCDVHKALES